MNAMCERDQGPLRFERRQCDRWEVSGAATACELGGEHFGRVHAMRALDWSDGGMGAISGTVITPGTTVSVGIQAPGHPLRQGVVSRCLPCGNGYRIAVMFERRMAA